LLFTAFSASHIGAQPHVAILDFFSRKAAIWAVF
jgi:hypothetical protein